MRLSRYAASPRVGATPWGTAAAPREDLAERILTRGRGHIANPTADTEELKRAAKNAYRLSPKMEDAVSLSMSVATIPGIGPVYADGILAEIGQVHRFPDHNALAQYALTWRRHQSGGFAAEDIPLTRSGNFFLRHYLTEAADRSECGSPNTPPSTSASTPRLVTTSTSGLSC